MKEEAMFKIAKLEMLCLVFMIALLAAPLLPAGEQKDPALAPVPAQIQAAKKVFISNAGGELKDWFTGGPNRHYDEFYAAMKDSGHYQLVAAPADPAPIFALHATGSYLSDREENTNF